jgi:DnaJ-class molecular chaperone
MTDKCPVCNGEGQVEHLTGYDPHDGSEQGWVEPCPYCGGTGEVEIEQEDL